MEIPIVNFCDSTNSVLARHRAYSYNKIQKED